MRLEEGEEVMRRRFFAPCPFSFLRSTPLPPHPLKIRFSLPLKPYSCSYR